MDDTCPVCAGCGKHGNKEAPLLFCARCGRTMYCCVLCQRKDWSEHKLVCKNSPEKRLQPNTDLTMLAVGVWAKQMCTPEALGDPLAAYILIAQTLFAAWQDRQIEGMTYVGTDWVGYDRSIGPPAEARDGQSIVVGSVSWPANADRCIFLFYPEDGTTQPEPMHPNAEQESMHDTMAEILRLLADIAGLPQPPAACVIIGAEFMIKHDKTTGEQVHKTVLCRRQLRLPIYGSNASADPDTAPYYLLPRSVDLVHVLSFFQHVLHTKCPCGKWRRNENGRWLHCNRCKKKVYCSRECQRNDWKWHKKVCIEHASA